MPLQLRLPLLLLPELTVAHGGGERERESGVGNAKEERGRRGERGERVDSGERGRARNGREERGEKDEREVEETELFFLIRFFF